MRWILLAALPLALATFSPPAVADKPDKELRKEQREERKATREKLRESREERRKARRAELVAKYGDILDKPAVKQELRLHAQRMARLHRMEKLAEAKGKEETKKRVADLLAKENARHDKKMGELKK